MAENKDPKAPVSQEVPTQPQEPQAGPAATADPVAQVALDAREADIAEREKKADETLARAEAVAKSVEDSLKKAQTVSQPSAAALEATNTEKSNLVTLLINKAFGDKELGAVQPFTPSVTLANNTEAGLITFEQGVEYQLPKLIVEDLVSRQQTFLAYKESVNIRSVVDKEVGKISGAGK